MIIFSRPNSAHTDGDMKYLCLAAACVFLLATSAQAQVTPGTPLLWDQPNAATAAIAQAYTFRVYADAATVGTVLSGVTCGTPYSVLRRIWDRLMRERAGTAPIVCQAPFPAFTLGPHTLTLSAANAAGEGPKSAAFAFTFVVVPSAPANLRSQ